LSLARPSSQARLRRAYFAWVAVCIVWGTTYLATKIAVESIPPFAMAGPRHVVAGVVIALVLWMRGVALPSRDSLKGHALLGFLMVGLGNGCLVWAQQYVPSGVAAVMISAIPFWMIGVEALMPDGERVRLRHLIGLILGFGGIAMLASSSLTGAASTGRLVMGAIMTQVSALGWAIGSAYAKRHKREENVFAATAVQIVFGGLMLMVVATVLGEWDDVRLTTRAMSAVLYLILAGTFVGYICYVYALKHLPVSIVSLYAYANPVIAVLLGSVVLKEPFTPRMATAITVIFAGMLVVRSADTSRSS
jgi:drug/metabolite transporter (DMT)-like permease